MTNVSTRRRMGFTVAPMQRRREPKGYQYLGKRVTFWIAVLSVISFVTGNMVAQHGLYAFWASVLGGYDESLIVYTGTVAPIASVPDYACWAEYGGDIRMHTFRQVPGKCLVPLPTYDVTRQRQGLQEQVYSIGHMGSYKSGADGEGSHVGVDMRVPKGTPVLAMANAIVQEVKNDPGGFGNYIVLRHPHVPDPASPRRDTTLLSLYAHLSTVFVEVGMPVKKGDTIGEVGATGFATGTHLHFQVQRRDAPYWVFTSAEARDAGMSFAQAVDAGLHRERAKAYYISPLLYVQANYPPATIVVAGEKERGAVPPAREERPRKTLAERRAERIAARKERVAVVTPPSTIVASAEPLQPGGVAVTPTMPIETPSSSATNFTTIELQHPSSVTERGWVTLTVTLRDAKGEKVHAPRFRKDMVFRTSYGTAEFDPPVLTELDFSGGEAQVKFRPKEQRTVVVIVQPYGEAYQAVSGPIQYIRN